MKKPTAPPPWPTPGLAGRGQLRLRRGPAFGQYGKVDNKTTGNSKRHRRPGRQRAAGNGKILAQWWARSNETGPKRKTFSAGYDGRFLSKRTDLGAVAMSDKITGQSSGSAFSIGIRHRY